MSQLVNRVREKRAAMKTANEAARIEREQEQEKLERHFREREAQLLSLLMTELDGHFGFRVEKTEVRNHWGWVAMVTHKHAKYYAVSTRERFTFRPSDESPEEEHVVDAWFIGKTVNPQDRDDFCVHATEGMYGDGKLAERFLERLVDWVAEKTKFD